MCLYVFGSMARAPEWSWRLPRSLRGSPGHQAIPGSLRATAEHAFDVFPASCRVGQLMQSLPMMLDPPYRKYFVRTRFPGFVRYGWSNITQVIALAKSDRTTRL